MDDKWPIGGEKAQSWLPPRIAAVSNAVEKVQDTLDSKWPEVGLQAGSKLAAWPATKIFNDGKKENWPASKTSSDEKEDWPETNKSSVVSWPGSSHTMSSGGPAAWVSPSINDLLNVIQNRDSRSLGVDSYDTHADPKTIATYQPFGDS